MKINKIVLYNFNSYEGMNEFDFKCDEPDKNIILIGGKNGAGKTSLFTAIKIALYGPLAFGYVGMNAHYISKIKDCINSKAFQKDVVTSGVQITLELMVEREIKEYEITRKWDFTKRKLEEDYFVTVDGKTLNYQELSYFENYLKSIIPPDLFEFFLFDGEEVGNIFSTKSYNTYVKDSIYTLCGLDVFEIIRKYAKDYAGKANNENEVKLYNQYEKLKSQEAKIKEKYSKIEQEINTSKEILEQIETELIEAETAFKNAGGISEKEKQILAKEYDEAEHEKSESATKIKMFVEGLMPFFIVNDFTERITKQLDFEEKSEIYYYVKNKLNREDIKLTLNAKDDVNDEAVDALMELLSSKFRPKGFNDTIYPIHDLSKEDTGRVNAMISSLNDFNVKEMIELIEKRKKASERTAEINKILKSAMTDEDARIFTERENNLLKKKDSLVRQINEQQLRLDMLWEECMNVKQKKDKAFQIFKDNIQDKHIYEISSGLTNIMDVVLNKKVLIIRKQLEKLIVEKLQHIYRKNNLITHIEIEDDFQFDLYQNATYSSTELICLMNNLGKENFLAEIGKYGLEELYRAYNVDSLEELKNVLADKDGEKINLYKRIDINRLSKGERQIFILSLYWAIIELSGQDIPFIIDTPYARIDANHRKEISEKFFPNISKQVIILSTDEEINEEYYEIIKPFIAKEFLLINDESQNHTTVEQEYFFGA